MGTCLALASLAVSSSKAQVYTWNVPSGGTWTNAANWDVGMVPVPNSDIVFSTPAATGSAKPTTLGATYTIRSLSFTPSQTGNVTIGAPSDQLTLAPVASGAITVRVDASSGDHSITSPVVLAAFTDQLFDVRGIRVFDIAADISGTSSSNGFTKIGTGVLRLSGTTNNSFGAGGSTVVSVGTLELNKLSSATVHAVSSSQLIIGDGTGLDIVRLVGSGGDQVADSTALRFNGSGPDAGTFQLNGSSETVLGLASVSGNGVVENAGAGTSTLTVSPTGTVTFDGVIRDGAAGVTGVAVTALGTQTLTNRNTYTDLTTVNRGQLEIAGAGAQLVATKGIQVNSGGTLLLNNGAGAVDRINNVAPITLFRGTIAAAGRSQEGTAAIRPAGSTPPGGSVAGLGSLTLNASSTLDFDSFTSGNHLVFAKFNPGSNVLNVMNWNNTVFDSTNLASGFGTDDRLVFQQDLIATGFLSQVNFGSGFAATQVDLGGGFFEIGATPVPEPATVFAGLALLGVVGYRERRWVRLALGRW